MKWVWILLGTSFAWADIVCYGIGCVVFWGAEILFKSDREG